MNNLGKRKRQELTYLSYMTYYIISYIISHIPKHCQWHSGPESWVYCQVTAATAKQLQQLSDFKLWPNNSNLCQTEIMLLKSCHLSLNYCQRLLQHRFQHLKKKHQHLNSSQVVNFLSPTHQSSLQSTTTQWSDSGSDKETSLILKLRRLLLINMQKRAVLKQWCCNFWQKKKRRRRSWKKFRRYIIQFYFLFIHLFLLVSIRFILLAAEEEGRVFLYVLI